MEIIKAKYILLAHCGHRRPAQLRSGNPQTNTLRHCPYGKHTYQHLTEATRMRCNVASRRRTNITVRSFVHSTEGQEEKIRKYKIQLIA